MRENIKDLKLGEIYDDYVQLKAMDEKYRYCSHSSVFYEAAGVLMALLKDEITRRKLEELEANHNLGPLCKKLDELSEFKNVTTTISTEDVTDYQQYTNTYTQNDNDSGDIYLFGLS